MTDWDEEDLSDIERIMLRFLRRSSRDFDASTFGEMDQLMRDILYGGLEPEEGHSASQSKEDFAAEPDDKMDPLVEMIEEKDAIRIVAEAPGAAGDDVVLKDLGNRVEISCGNVWRRSFKVPSGLLFQRATKSLKNGVLEIVIPRTRTPGGGV
mgnify:CR=1 FL=1